MFSPRFSFLTLALLVCGFQEQTVSAAAMQNAQPALATDYLTTQDQYKELRTSLHISFTTNISGSITEVTSENFSKKLQDVSKFVFNSVAKFKNDKDSEAFRHNCDVGMKQDFLKLLATWESACSEKLGKAQGSEKELLQSTITELHKCREKTEADFKVLMATHKEQAAPKPIADSRKQEIEGVASRHGQKAPQKVVQPTEKAKEAIATPATPGSKTKWIIAAALAVTALTYGQVQHKMLTKMFTQMTKYLTPLATRMGLVKVEKVVAPMVVKQLSFWQRFMQMLRFA